MTVTKEGIFRANIQTREPEIHTLGPRHSLTVEYLFTREGAWNYTRGTIVDSTGAVVAIVERNYGSFWYCYHPHTNGHEYVLCSADYHGGYTVIDLNSRERLDYTPPEDKWCWVVARSCSDNRIEVEGCYWAGPYERIVFDFKDPWKRPLPELTRDWLGDDSDEEGEEAS